MLSGGQPETNGRGGEALMGIVTAGPYSAPWRGWALDLREATAWISRSTQDLQ